MNSLRCAALSILALAFVGGCARSKITTEIKSDGSWTRAVALTGPEKQEGGMQMGSSLEETFAVPSGSQWKSREEKKEGDRTLTFERKLTAGTILRGDLSIKEDQSGKMSITNEATVSRLAPRRFEYKETIRWTGTPGKASGLDIKPEELAKLKAALPKALATDANATAVAQKTAALVVPLLFGPGDPLLAIGLMHPELAMRRASQRIGSAMMKALEEQFGDKMTPAQRRDTTRNLIETSFNSARPSKPDPTAGPPTGEKGNSSGLIPLMFIVKGPGHLVSSNGELDEMAGEVYWALFPEAASLNPVTLTAVWESDK